MQSPLDLPTVQAVGEHSTHPSLQASATAWLGAYALAHQFSFTEAVALRHADAAWDRVAEFWHQPLLDEPDDELTEPGRRPVDLPR
jgi:hypothetical protein